MRGKYDDDDDGGGNDDCKTTIDNRSNDNIEGNNNPNTKNTTKKTKKNYEYDNKRSNNNSNNKYPQWHNVVSGAVAGIGARLASAPFDLLKIRLQLQQSIMTTRASHPHVDSAPTSTSAYVGNMFQNFSKIMKEEGVTALFKGNVAATYLWVGYAAVQFSLYARISGWMHAFANDDYYTLPTYTAVGEESCFLYSSHTLKHQVQSMLVAHPSIIAFLSGASAGICATLATYPFDVCRTNFAAQSVSAAASGMVVHRSILSYAKYTLQAKGLPGFFAGIGPAVVQIIPYMGINFALYDYIVRMTERHNVGGAGAAGAVAGGTSKLLVYPMDTVKRRLQAQSFGRTSVSELTPSMQYKGMRDCIIKISQNEGVAAFYKGLSPTVFKSMISTGMTFACFTASKNFLETMHDSRHSLED